MCIPMINHAVALGNISHRRGRYILNLENILSIHFLLNGRIAQNLQEALRNITDTNKNNYMIDKGKHQWKVLI